MVVLALLLLSLSGGACTESLEPAMAALRQNDPAKAIAILEPLRNSCPQSSSFHELLGLAGELNGRSDVAEAELKTASSLDPNEPRLLAELGATYLRNRKAEEAAKVLDEASRLDPSNPAILKYRIAAYVQLSDWSRAALVFREMGAENNSGSLNDPILMVWFARTLIETNRAQALQRLLPPRQNGMPPGVLFSVGTLLAQHRMYEQAIPYLECIPEQSADDAVYFNLGLAYSHLQRAEQARKYYFKAIDLHPQHLEAYFHIGLDYASAGNPRFAIPWLMQAHEFAPKRSDISYALAEQLIGLSYTDTAQQVLQQTEQQNPEDPLLLVAEGDLKQTKGETAAAAEIYERALRLKRDFASALVAMARLETAQGTFPTAEARLRKVISADPGNSAALAGLGLLEARRERWDSAVRLLDQAWRADHSNSETALALARVYRHLGRPADALRTLESLKTQQQGSAAFHVELAQSLRQLHRDAEARAELDSVNRLEAQTHNALHFESPRTYVH